MHPPPFPLVGMATHPPSHSLSLIFPQPASSTSSWAAFLTPLAVLTYPRGRCKTGCGDEFVIFPFPFFFGLIDSGVSLAIFSRSKKKPLHPIFSIFLERGSSQRGLWICTCRGDDSRALSCSRSPHDSFCFSFYLSLCQQLMLMGLQLPAQSGLRSQQHQWQRGRVQERVPCSLQAVRTWWERRFSLEYVDNWGRVWAGFTCNARNGLWEKSGWEVWFETSVQEVSNQGLSNQDLRAPDLKGPVRISLSCPQASPQSSCTALVSSSFLLEPEPTLAYFHTPSPVAWSLTKLNFNYFFLIKSLVKTPAFNWQQLLGLMQWGRMCG